MGNWMRLQLTGTCDESEVEALKTALVVDMRGNFDSDAWKNVGPLSVSEGLCGLGTWPPAVISVVGNAFERRRSRQVSARAARRHRPESRPGGSLRRRLRVGRIRGDRASDGRQSHGGSASRIGSS